MNEIDCCDDVVCSRWNCFALCVDRGLINEKVDFQCYFTSNRVIQLNLDDHVGIPSTSGYLTLLCQQQRSGHPFMVICKSL